MRLFCFKFIGTSSLISLIYLLPQYIKFLSFHFLVKKYISLLLNNSFSIFFLAINAFVIHPAA